MDCNQEIFRDFLSNCNTAIQVNALLEPATGYTWVIKSKSADYSGEVTTDGDGFASIDVTDPATLPAGLINSFGGVYSLQFFRTTDLCKAVSFKMVRYYDEIFFETVRGTRVKDNLGCDFECTSANGTGNSAVFPFTDVSSLDIPWTSLLNTLYGAAPTVQVYQLTAPDTYELVTVSVVLTGSPLTNIHVDFGGNMTGYVLIN